MIGDQHGLYVADDQATEGGKSQLFMNFRPPTRGCLFCSNFMFSPPYRVLGGVEWSCLTKCEAQGKIKPNKTVERSVLMNPHKI